MSKLKPFVAFLTFTIVEVAFAYFLSNNRISAVNAKEKSNEKPPVVKIIDPKDKSIHSWNSLVDYDIIVSDHGKSTRFQELPANKVLLKTTYVPDLSRVNSNAAQTETDPAGLLDIMSSNCLGCHGLKSAAMGPSFAAISKRYPDTAATRDSLSQHIRDGSAGMWGQASMPPHPELSEIELNTISLWIMAHAADPGVNYYVGTDGAFRMDSPGKPGLKAGEVLTASYVSQGTGKLMQQSLRGEDSIIVAGK